MVSATVDKAGNKYMSRKASFIRNIGRSTIFPAEWAGANFAEHTRDILNKNGNTEGQAQVFDDYEMQDEDLSFRRILQRWLIHSNWGYRLELFNCLLSMLACFLYVWETYETSDTMIGFTITELVFSTFFIADYVLQLYLADNRLRHIFKTEAMIDLLTITPVFLNSLQADIMFMRVLRVIRVVRVLRIMRVNRFIMSSIDSEVSQEIASVGLTVVSAAFFGAGIIHQVDNFHREQNWLPLLQFHDALYFVVVTISTVGFGDINPESDISKLIVMLLIIAGLIYIPKSTNNLIQLMSNDSVYARRKYKANRQCQHVIICGHIHIGGAKAALNELFHEDHGKLDLHAVLMLESEPSSGLINLLKDARFSLSVTLLRGSVFDSKDLSRAAAESAAAIFVLTDQLSEESDKQDATTILRAMSVKRYVKNVNGGDVMTCVQLMRPENKFHFGKYFNSSTEDATRAGSQEGNSTGNKLRRMQTSTNLAAHGLKAIHKINPVVCIDEIKMNLLAQSCLCPGIVTMVANLIMSVDAPTNVAQGKKQIPGWVSEYHEGCEYEIYRTKLSPLFTGLPFNLVAMMIYKYLGVCMLAIEVGLVTNSCQMKSEVVINPGQLKIPDVSKHSIHGFVIARDKSAAELSTVGYSTMGEASTTNGKPSPGCALSLAYDNLAKAMTHLHINVSGSGLDLSERHTKMSTIQKSSSGLSQQTGFESFCDEDVQSVPDLTENNALRKVSTAPPGDTQELEGRPSMLKHVSFIIHEANNSNESEDESNASDSNSTQGDAEVVEEISQNDSFNSSIPTLRRSHTMDPNSRTLTSQNSIQSRMANLRLLSKIRGGALKKLIKSDLNNLDRQNYYTLDQPKKLQEATIETSFMEEFPGQSGHIVITGSIHNISYLVRTLRARHLGQAKVIVILHDTLPSAQSWKSLAHYPAVYLIEGSALSQDDLYRAGVSVASCAVVIANSHHDAASITDAKVDATSIFAHQGMIEMNPSIQIVTEVICHDNVEFLDLGIPITAELNTMMSTPGSSGGQYTNTLQFISGNVFSSSVLDTLVGQAFFNPHIPTVLQKLVAGNGTNLLMTRGTLQKGYNEDSQALLRTMKDSNVFQIPLPKEYHDKTYGQLFMELCGNKGILALGLRRTGPIESEITSGSFKSPKQQPRLGYTVTNPPSNLQLHESDKVFILSQDVPTAKLSGISGGDFFTNIATSGGIGIDKVLDNRDTNRLVDRSDLCKVMAELKSIKTALGIRQVNSKLPAL